MSFHLYLFELFDAIDQINDVEMVSHFFCSHHLSMHGDFDSNIFSHFANIFVDCSTRYKHSIQVCIAICIPICSMFIRIGSLCLMELNASRWKSKTIIFYFLFRNFLSTPADIQIENETENK